jgi:hypothetical protein
MGRGRGFIVVVLYVFSSWKEGTGRMVRRGFGISPIVVGEAVHGRGEKHGLGTAVQCALRSS